jgi:hypothetical protein
VRALEKLYKALGIDPAKVFGDLHTNASLPSTISSTVGAQVAPTSGGGFRLDTERIAQLQKDTEKVSALLTSIFTEEELAAPSADELPVDPAAGPASFLDLDDAHSAFAKQLLSRPAWTRAELAEMCADLDLMLDGALERVNEAAFDAHDIPFTEGEDPVEVNAELKEKIEA